MVLFILIGEMKHRRLRLEFVGVIANLFYWKPHFFPFLPLVSFDEWSEYQQSHPQAQPLPLALAPNRMTDALSEAGGWPPFLDHSLTRQFLIDLLAALP